MVIVGGACELTPYCGDPTDSGMVLLLLILIIVHIVDIVDILITAYC